MISINSREIVLTFASLQNKELWLLRDVKRADLKLLGRIPAGAFHAFRALSVKIHCDRENKCGLRDSLSGSSPGFFPPLSNYPSNDAVHGRALSTFDPAAMYIARNLTRRNFRRGHGGLIEAN